MPSRPSTLKSTSLFITALLVVPLTLGSLVGCGSTSASSVAAATARDADFNTGYPVEPGHARSLGYDVRWVHNLPLGGGQTLAHVFEDQDTLVTVEAPTNIVSALDPGTGATLWKTVVGSQLERVVGMTSDDRWVFVNTTKRVFKLARSSGEVKSIANLQYPVNSSPVKAGRLAIYGSDVGNVFAHHLDDGYSKWAYALGAPIQASPILLEREVFAVDSRGQYATLDVNTGSLLWRGQFYAGVSADPVHHEGFVLVASEDQSLYSLGEVNGKDRWPAFRSETRLTSTPLAFGGGIALNEPGVGMSAISAFTGERFWQFEADVQPLDADNRTVLAYNQDGLVLLSSSDGSVKQAVPSRRLSIAQCDDDRQLLLCTADGSLIRLSRIPTGASVVLAGP